MSPALVLPRSRPKLTEPFGRRITQEGIVYMDNNTTISGLHMVRSSRKIVDINRPCSSSMDDLQMSMDDQTTLDQTDEYTTLGEISSVYSSY